MFSLFPLDPLSSPSFVLELNFGLPSLISIWFTLLLTPCNSFVLNKITLWYFSDQCLLCEVICQDANTCCAYEVLLDTELKH